MLQEAVQFYANERTLSSSLAVVLGVAHSTLFSTANLSKNMLASENKKISE